MGAELRESVPAPAPFRASLSKQPQCFTAGAIEERAGDSLEALLTEEVCPFLATFFSTSSPLARTAALAELEQQVAAAFPELRYFRVDADQLSMRAFLQWDIAFLPTLVLYSPPDVPGRQGHWHRWKGGSAASPYEFATVANFVTRFTGLRPGNSSSFARPTEGGGLLPKRGSETWYDWQLAASWVLVVLAAFQWRYGPPLGVV